MTKEVRKVSFKELVAGGVHFGHQTSRWHPKMAPYIWGQRNGVHLIDVSKTASALERAAQFLHDLVASGKPVLWVGTKKSAQQVVKDVATELEMPFVVHRWIGGLLTNFSQVRRSVTNLQHLEDVIAKSEQFPYTKKELSGFQKSADRLEKNVGGIRKLGWPVGAVVVVDVRKEATAIREASECGVPVIGLVDTNADPSLVDFVIPANDDSPKSIKVVIDILKEAIAQGKKRAFELKKQAKAAQEEKAAANKDAQPEEVASEASEEPTEKKAAAKTPARKPAAKKPATTKKTTQAENSESAE